MQATSNPRGYGCRLTSNCRSWRRCASDRTVRSEAALLEACPPGAIHQQHRRAARPVVGGLDESRRQHPLPLQPDPGVGQGLVRRRGAIREQREERLAAMRAAGLSARAVSACRARWTLGQGVFRRWLDNAVCARRQSGNFRAAVGVVEQVARRAGDQIEAVVLVRRCADLCEEAGRLLLRQQVVAHQPPARTPAGLARAARRGSWSPQRRRPVRVRPSHVPPCSRSRPARISAMVFPEMRRGPPDGRRTRPGSPPASAGSPRAASSRPRSGTCGGYSWKHSRLRRLPGNSTASSPTDAASARKEASNRAAVLPRPRRPPSRGWARRAWSAAARGRRSAAAGARTAARPARRASPSGGDRHDSRRRRLGAHAQRRDHPCRPRRRSPRLGGARSTARPANRIRRPVRVQRSAPFRRARSRRTGTPAARLPAAACGRVQAEQPALDLPTILGARDDLLPRIAALGEADRPQLLEVGHLRHKLLLGGSGHHGDAGLDQSPAPSIRTGRTRTGRSDGSRLCSSAGPATTISNSSCSCSRITVTSGPRATAIGAGRERSTNPASAADAPGPPRPRSLSSALASASVTAARRHVLLQPATHARRRSRRELEEIVGCVVPHQQAGQHASLRRAVGAKLCARCVEHADVVAELALQEGRGIGAGWRARSTSRSAGAAVGESSQRGTLAVGIAEVQHARGVEDRAGAAQVVQPVSRRQRSNSTRRSW